MRRASIIATVVVLVVLAGLAAVTGSTAPRSSVANASSAPVTSAVLVCPDITGSPPGTISRASIADVAPALTPPSHSTGTVSTTVLAGSKSKPKAVQPAPAVVIHSVTKTTQHVEVNATGSVAASTAGDVVVESATGRSRAMSAVRCAAPATDWWFTGADGRVGFSDLLFLSNPSQTPAEVGVSLFGQNGPHDNTTLESFPVGAHATKRITVASAAPDIANVGIHVHATSGAITAAVLERRSSGLKSNGGDFIPATAPPATGALVSGFAPGKGPRYVVVTAPGDQDATVALHLVTASGTFQPSGINQVVVRAGHTKAVSISSQLGQSAGAALLTSDQPIVANGISIVPESGQRPDLMWSAATPALTGPAAIANGRQPDGGKTSLYLTAPQGAAQVKVTTPSGHSQTISVPAGKTSVTDITSTIKSSAVTWPFVVTPVGSAPVFGVDAMAFTGAHGELIAGEPLIALPRPIPLPPVRQDQRVAVQP
jgi:hypothetical protein